MQVPATDAVEKHSPPSRAQRQSLVAGLIAAIAGGLVGGFVALGATGQGFAVFAMAGPAAGLLAGASIWHWLVTRRGRYGLLRGAMTGVLIVIAGHCLTWYLAMLGSWLCHAFTGGCVDSLGQGPIDPLNALWAAIAIGLLSLIVTGWATLPVGILTGCLLARAQRPAVSNDARAPGAPDR